MIRFSFFTGHSQRDEYFTLWLILTNYEDSQYRRKLI